MNAVKVTRSQSEPGYIQLRRSRFRELTQRAWPTQRLVIWALFHELLLRANFESGFVDEVPLKRGQCVAGRDRLAEVIGASVSKVRTALTKLESWGELAIKATSRGMVITIVYYDTYVAPAAGKDQKSRQQIASTSPADNQQLATQKNEEQDNKESKTVMTCDDEHKSAIPWDRTQKGNELVKRLSDLGYNLTQKPSHDALQSFVAMHGLKAVEFFVLKAEKGTKNGSIQNPGGLLYRWFDGAWAEDDGFQCLNEDKMNSTEDGPSKVRQDNSPVRSAQAGLIRRGERSRSARSPQSISEIMQSFVDDPFGDLARTEETE